MRKTEKGRAREIERFSERERESVREREREREGGYYRIFVGDFTAQGACVIHPQLRQGQDDAYIQISRITYCVRLCVSARVCLQACVCVYMCVCMCAPTLTDNYICT